MKPLSFYLKNPSKGLLALLKKSCKLFTNDKLYLELLFRLEEGYKIDLKNPKTFNEKLQWLKLYNRKDIYTTMVDKYTVKEFVAERIGNKYVLPLLGVWNSVEEIDFDALPDEFVLKTTHGGGCTGVVICKGKSEFDFVEAKKKLAKSMKSDTYFFYREWPYKNVTKRIIAEEFLKPQRNINNIDNKEFIDVDTLQSIHGLLDYKFMCFDGKVKALFLDIGVIGDNTIGHSDDYYRSIYDRDFNELPFNETRQHYPTKIIKPVFFDEMVKIAEKLSEGIPHVRVDLYCINNEIKFGEFTFFHGGGFGNYFSPHIWNRTLGDWIKLPIDK